MSVPPRNYISHIIHSDLVRDWSGERFIRTVVIDPGLVNMGFRIERRDLVEKRVITEVWLRKEFRAEKENEKPATTYMGELVAFLDRYEEYYAKTHFILIERQFLENYAMTRAGPMIVSYYATKLRNAPLRPMLVEMFSTMKSQVLVDKDTLLTLMRKLHPRRRPTTLKTDNDVKDWAIHVSPQLLKARKDTRALEIMEKDDKRLEFLKGERKMLKKLLREDKKMKEAKDGDKVTKKPQGPGKKPVLGVAATVDTIAQVTDQEGSIKELEGVEKEIKSLEKLDDRSDVVVMPDAFFLRMQFEFNKPFLKDLLSVDGLHKNMATIVKKAAGE